MRSWRAVGLAAGSLATMLVRIDVHSSPRTLAMSDFRFRGVVKDVSIGSGSSDFPVEASRSRVQESPIEGGRDAGSKKTAPQVASSE